MSWYETLAWIMLALTLEKILDYAVWPSWLRRRKAKQPKGKGVVLILTPKQTRALQKPPRT